MMNNENTAEKNEEVAIDVEYCIPGKTTRVIKYEHYFRAKGEELLEKQASSYYTSFLPKTCEFGTISNFDDVLLFPIVIGLQERIEAFKVYFEVLNFDENSSGRNVKWVKPAMIRINNKNEVEVIKRGVIFINK